MEVTPLLGDYLTLPGDVRRQVVAREWTFLDREFNIYLGDEVKVIP